MSERWPRFGFKQQPAVDVEAASPPASNGADPERAGIAAGPDAQASAAQAEAMTAIAVKPDAPEDPGTVPIALAATAGPDGAIKPWETPETPKAAAPDGEAPKADARKAEAAPAEAPKAEAAPAEAPKAEAVEAAAVEEKASEAAASEETPPEVEAEPITAEEGTTFLGELVRAMQATAKGERTKIDEETERRRVEHVEQIRTRQASEADRMRELADGDRKSIEQWAEGEAKRIQLEREKRETELNKDLEVSLANHSASIDRQIETLETAISTYRGEVATFFEALDRETDPVLIAQRASQRPAFPDLDAITAAPVPAEPAMVGVMGATEPPARLGSWAAPNVTSPDDAEAVGVVQPIGAVHGQRSGTSLLETVPAERPMSWLRRARTVGEDDTNQEG